MTIATDYLNIETRGDCDMLDLTDRLQSMLRKHKMRSGSMLVFISFRKSTILLSTNRWQRRPGRW